jgi:hypothetical protein
LFMDPHTLQGTPFRGTEALSEVNII